MINHKTIYVTAFFLTLLLIMPLSLFGQNLFQNDELMRSRQLQIQAQQAFEDGDYDRSVELSIEAEKLAVLGREKAEQTAHAFRANTLYNRAKSRIDYVRLIGAAERVADRYQRAQTLHREAKTTLDAGEYDRSMELSREVIALLENITPQRLARDAALPRYYEVRLIPERRDCFWRIAEYDFVYDDPRQWPKLYEANKDKLQDLNNPRLIQPGIVLEIPSLDGERREGTWSP
jgi:nucleoid-associated protein YgaU